MQLRSTLLSLALLLPLACDVEDDTSTRSGDGVIGAGRAIDLADLDADDLDADAAADAAADDLDIDDLTTAPLYAYCDDVSTWSSAWAKLEADVLTLVNQRRAAGATCGGVAKPPVPALTLDTRLRCAARKHSKDMGTKNFFSHTGSNGSTFVQRIESAGYTAWLALAENIAAGQTTASSVVTSWMASTGHCNNIMNGTFKHLGVGYYYAGTATYKHYWTQDFGKR